MSRSPVRLLLSDVDGTLVTSDKILTPRTIRAVEHLRDAGIAFAITSARPPQGLMQFVEPLNITTPLAAFNGGLLVDREFNVVKERIISAEVVSLIIEVLDSHGLYTWVFRGADWFVVDKHGPHVEREAFVCQCDPTVRTNYVGIGSGVSKLVGVSDDLDMVAAVQAIIVDRFGPHVSATRSQPYYLDITHPDANKGNVVQYLAALYDIAPSEIATIGDMQNDVSMFVQSGLSIAMGNAESAVQEAAYEVTRSNNDEGFAHAVETFVLS